MLSTTLRDSLYVSSRTRNGISSLATLEAWIQQRRAALSLTVAQRSLEDLDQWAFDEVTGDLRHRSGSFFAVRGLTNGRESHIILDQPEVGLLGLLLTVVNGTAHVLVQMKHEPGSVAGAQLSPTVQATRSNIDRRHGGRAVPYLESFTTAPASVIHDSLQSEHGTWFFRKVNRNLVVAGPPTEPLNRNFMWVTLGQLYYLTLNTPDLIGMDLRSTLACLPTFERDCQCDATPLEYLTPLHRSTPSDVLSGFRLAPLRETARPADRLSTPHGSFEIIGVDVSGGEREVDSWQQPLLHPLIRRTYSLPIRSGSCLEIGLCVRYEFGLSHPQYSGTEGDNSSETLLSLMLYEEGGRTYDAETCYRLSEDTSHDATVWVPSCAAIALSQQSSVLTIEARTLLLLARALRATPHLEPGQTSA